MLLMVVTCDKCNDARFENYSYDGTLFLPSGWIKLLPEVGGTKFICKDCANSLGLP